MSTGDGQPFDPRSVRYQPLIWFLRGATIVTFVLAALAVVAPETLGSTLAVATAALLVAAPLIRVLWLIVRWWRRGDLLFVSVGIALLLIVGGGGAIASVLS